MKILLGMSGGVDSSVAAGLLTRAGHQVTGVTLKLWEGEEGPDAPWQSRSCCKVGIARHVCEQVCIPHIVVDAQADFRRHVVDDFLSGYEAGETPNPCVRCNEQIKFRALLDYAKEHGFDQIATGHYARIERTGTGAHRLLTGYDPNKDQSYFLYRIPKADLSRIRFPLGAMRKPQVMQMAREQGFPADEIAESQEICFVNTGDYRDFLQAERPGTNKPGDIINMQGDVIGQHGGVALATVGQRRGLNVAAGERIYVIETDATTNTVTMGPDEALLCDGLEAADLNLLAPVTSDRVQVKIRYRSPAVPARVEWLEDRLKVIFDTPQRAITPGQSVVLYDGETVLGGGIIARALRTGLPKMAAAS